MWQLFENRNKINEITVKRVSSALRSSDHGVVLFSKAPTIHKWNIVIQYKPTK